MSRSFKIFLLAIVLLAGISVISVYLSSGGDLQGRFSFDGVRERSAGDSDTENGVFLEAINSTAPDFIPKIGTEQVVMAFELKAATDLTIRYVPFEMTVRGYDLAALGDPANWKVYEMNLKTGAVDYSKQAAVGSDVYMRPNPLEAGVTDIFVRLRFFAPNGLQTSGFRINSAKDDAAGLALVTKVLTAGDSSGSQQEPVKAFKVDFLKTVNEAVPAYAWSWALGDQSSKAWALVEEKKSLEGLMIKTVPSS